MPLTPGSLQAFALVAAREAGLPPDLPPRIRHVLSLYPHDNNLLQIYLQWWKTRGGEEGARALKAAVEALDFAVSTWLAGRGGGGDFSIIKVLNLDNNNLGPEGAAALAPALQVMTGLQQIHLARNNLGPEGAAALAPALRVMTGLQILWLGDNDLGPEGVAALIPALKVMTGLRWIDLSDNNLDRDTAYTLGRAMATNTVFCYLANTDLNAAFEVGKSNLPPPT